MSSNYPPFGNAPSRACQHCGSLLPPHEARCANCGFMNSPVAQSSSGMAWGGAVPQQSFNTGQQWGQPSANPGQAVPNSPFANSAVPQQAFGQSNTPNASMTSTNPFYGASNQQQSATSNSAFGMPGQQTGANINGFGVYAPAPQQQFFSQQASQPTTGTFQNSGTMNGFGQAQPQQQSGFSSPNNGFGQFAQQQNGFPPNAMNGFGQPAQQPNSFASSGFAQQQSLPNSNFTTAPGMNTFQNTGFAQSPPMNDYQPALPAARKRKPKIGLIITAVVLLVLLVGGGLGGYYYVKHSGNATTQITPTMGPTPTPAGKALFSDTFANNNNGWDLTTKAGQFSVKVGGGSMVLEDDNNRLLWELVPGGKNFSDFYMTVDATLSKGTQSNGYGIYIRGASNQTIDIATYYRFELYGDGTFAIFKGSVDATGTSSSTALVNYTNSPIIQKQGKVNHIAINAKGSTMTFYINGQVIKIVTDNTYTTGSIALFVSNLQNTAPGAQATFANLAIYPPQAQ